MFLQESIQHCSVCEEQTPHSQRAIALPKWICAAALVGAVFCFFQAMPLPLLGGLLLLVALFALLRERDKYWSIRCERCRGKKLMQLRRTKRVLDGTTEVFFLS